MVSCLLSSSVQFLGRVRFYATHGLQHARPPCLSQTPGVYSNSCPLSPWCHPTISSFVVPFSSHLQSFPALGSFQMSQLFASGGQSIRVSASASVLLMVTSQLPTAFSEIVHLQSFPESRSFPGSQFSESGGQIFGVSALASVLPMYIQD